MRSVIKWCVEHPTIVNLLTAALCILGLVTIDMIPKESFPETALDTIVVRVIQRGAGPAEMETGVLLKVEEAIQGIAGVKRITAESRENLGTLNIEVSRGNKTERVLRDVKDQVEQINSFPVDAERPVVFEVMRRIPVLQLALYGNVSRASLQTLSERVKDDLLDKKSITQVSVLGEKIREISIEVNEPNLRQYGLQISDVARAISGANLDISGGTLRTRREDLVIRAYGKRYLAKQLEDIVVRTRPGATPILVRDVARARETFEDNPQEYYFKSKPAILLNVERITGENSLKIAADGKAYIKEAKKILPPGVELALVNDTTNILRERLKLLINNGLQGLVLVLLTLSLLMNLRLAFWVAAGLPVAMLGSMILILFSGLTINAISLFGLILVIGILVDDAIVIGENIYSHLEMGKTPVQAAIDGTAEVVPAVLAAVTTTMMAFAPLFIVGGLIGKFIYMIPAVVIITLLLSLVESILILPPHLAHALKPTNSVEHQNSRIREALDRGFQWVNTKLYAIPLRFSLRNRWAVVAFSITLLFLTFGLMGGGFVKFVFFPRIDSDRLVARFVMEPGTPVKKTKELALRIEKAALTLNAKLKKKHNVDVILHTAKWIGQNGQQARGFAPPTGEEVGEITIELLDGEQRPLSSFLIANLWRKETGNVQGTIRLTFGSATVGPVGRPIELNVSSNDQEQLQIATEFIKKRLATYAGIEDIEDDLTPGKRELRLKLTPLAQSLGMTLQQLAVQVRNRIYGQEVMRIQRGRDEVRVFVRYPDASRNSVRDLRNIWIATPSGEKIPLNRLATWTSTRDLQIIRRIDRKRISTITSELDEDKGNRQDIVIGLLTKDIPALQKIAPAAKVEFGGQGREQAEAFSGLRIAFPLALFGIFIILMLVFQSYAQSFVVMAMIPFGLIGAVFGHLVMGVPLTILSMFGIVGLAGVVVNDSLVLMDVINRNIVNGMDPFEAAWQGGQSRLRPILSTTLTTVAGLAPLLFERSLQAQFLIPMAISLAFGVAFATFITLILVPSLYIVINDMRRFFHWLRHGVWADPTSLEPTYIRHLQEIKEEEDEAAFAAPLANGYSDHSQANHPNPPYPSQTHL
ncbi:MAG: efflux RND transporter permease subunit [Myxococcales bacterium]|nr:efflux RND transporter permease subunit [Myxococcales bacterium]